MASIRTRKSQDGATSYFVEIRLKGYPPQRASFDRLTDARKWAASTESAIREGRHFKTAEAKKHTFNDVAARYNLEVLPHYSEREQKERKAKLDWWNERLKDYLLSDITPALIVQNRDSFARSENRQGEKISPATVNRYLALISHVFTIAVNEWQWLEDNPVKKVKRPKEPRGRVRFLDDDERNRLLQACKESSNEVLYLCVILALSTGMRQGELMGLLWRDVDLKKGNIILHETKNGERRRVPLAGHGLELLREYGKIRRLDSPLMFPSYTNPISPINLRSAFTFALERAEIKDFHWHDLRHCTASYLAMNGASLAEIAEILGHKTLAMVKRYSHLSDGHVSSVVARMNDKIFGGV
ncbi:MAG: site-specific integrase [Methylococcaceae bacterium]|nr:site-specific integrase [Methylococcaceae bacterium]